MTDNSLKSRTVKGAFWSAIDAFLGKGVTFIVGIVLARILTPEEYGLIGIVSIFIVVLSGFVSCGFFTALIRKKEVSNDDYNTMFITNLVLSILLFSLLYIIAPYISVFFDRPSLTAIARVMGALLIIQALSITQVTILTKRIDFKTKTKASVVSGLLSGVLGIIMAYRGFGVWSLVGQQLSQQTIFTICLWFLNKWWPSLQFSISSFKYMWGFGWKMVLSSLLNNIWDQLYQVVVGKYYSPSTLGQYSRANEYATLFSSNFILIIQRVSLPALAEVQDDEKRLLSAYRKIIKLAMFVTVVTLFSLGAVSEPFIFCLLGPKWSEAASYLPLICISMSLYPLHVINLNMLQIQGRSDIFLILEIIKKIIAIGPVCLGIFIGIYWMLLGGIVVGIISFFLNSYYTGKKLNYSSWSQLKDVMPSYLLGIIIAFSVFFLKYLPLSYWFVLPIQLIVGLCIFIMICRIGKFKEYDEILDLRKQLCGSFRLGSY